MPTNRSGKFRRVGPMVFGIPWRGAFAPTGASAPNHNQAGGYPMRRFTRKRVVAALSLIAVLAVAGSAYAYFTSTGNGTGSGTVGAATNWGVATTTSGGPLYPGVSATDQTAHLTITNNGSGKQELNAFTISVAGSGGSTWTSSTTNYPTENACSAADFALGGQASSGSYTVSGIADDLAPGATYTTTVNMHMLDTGVPQDNCQNVTAPLYISAS